MSLPESCLNLMAMLDSPRLFDIPLAELRPLQVKAASDLYEDRRDKLPVLAQRGDDCGVKTVKSAADVVPLLFSHTTYKSYPESFVSNRRWDMLTRWFQTVSTVPVQVDLTGVVTIDDWVDRMWSHGHFVYATSGTMGKCSFLNHTKADRDFAERAFATYMGWPHVWPLDAPKRRYYQVFPFDGPQAPMHWFRTIARLYARPDATFTMADEPIRVSQLNRAGAMRKAMSENRVSSAEIAAFEAEAAERQERVNGNLRRMVADMVEHRHEPMIINMGLQMSWVLKIARELGAKEGDFADVAIMGKPRKRGGNVGDLAEIEADMMRFFQPKKDPGYYGMTELSTVMPQCEAKRYHLPPWIMLLLLDRNGNQLVEEGEGVAEGRAGFLDFSREGRWGGLITGDKLQVDFSPKCACGRAGPGILEQISRFSDTGEDKVDCAGTFEAYVRGVISEPEEAF